MFSFEHTEFLIGLFIIIPLVLLFVSVLLWKKKVKKVLGDDKLISQLTKNYSEKRYRLKFILISACIILLIVAAANLRKPVTGEKERKAGYRCDDRTGCKQKHVGRGYQTIKA